MNNPLRSFNTTTIGLFFGYLLGISILLVFNEIVDIEILPFSAKSLSVIKFSLFIASVLTGVVLTRRASSDIRNSIPFIRIVHKKIAQSEIILDYSTLLDGRIIDLCSNNLFDHRLVCPRFLVKDLIVQQESCEKAKTALETLTRLETMDHLNLRFEESDFPELKEIGLKTCKLAELLKAYVLTAEMSRVQIATIDEIKIININSLAQSLKPAAPKGEYLEIQIQRYGKEENQGVGYLEDGTMVVVNGGAEFLGSKISARVVSIKHTTAGRMIFCNAL